MSTTQKGGDNVLRSLNYNKYVVIHTYGTDVDSDVSFQKGAWDMEKRRKNLENVFSIREDWRDNLAVIGFNQDDQTVCYIEGSDEDVLNKKDGNILITKTKTALMGWAADCCLVALAANDGEIVSVLHASVKTLKNGVVGRAINAVRAAGGTEITAFIGACAGACCYEYGKDQAYVDFADYRNFIIPIDGFDTKVKLDLYGAVKEALCREKVNEIVDLFPKKRCTICSTIYNGESMFSSYRREKGQNGQYGLVISKL